MPTDMQLKALKPTGNIHKVADQQGLYVAVTHTGTVSFRFDYRINGRRETQVIGQYDSSLGARKPRGLEELDYGMSLTPGRGAAAFDGSASICIARREPVTCQG